jgi:hypothetical protein
MRGKVAGGVKLTNHLPNSDKVKKLWIYTSTPPHAFMV